MRAPSSFTAGRAEPRWLTAAFGFVAWQGAAMITLVTASICASVNRIGAEEGTIVLYASAKGGEYERTRPPQTSGPSVVEGTAPVKWTVKTLWCSPMRESMATNAANIRLGLLSPGLHR